MLLHVTNVWNGCIMNKHIEVSLMEDGQLSIDGHVKPAGNIEIREFNGGEWTGGSYATYDNLIEKVKEALDPDYE